MDAKYAGVTVEDAGWGPFIDPNRVKAIIEGVEKIPFGDPATFYYTGSGSAPEGEPEADDPTTNERRTR